MQKQKPGPVTTAKKEAPPIPHVTANYVSLQHLVLAVANQSFAEIQNLLRTLKSISSDVLRKHEFLKVLVVARQEFVKLYVLCKWAVVSGEIGRTIDVAAWLHGQHNAFNNVVGVLFHLQQSLGSAKLQHADIESALQVLKHGGPKLSTMGFVAPKPLTDRTVFETLRHLNLLLELRLALAEKLPPIYRNYTISSGRARFTVPGYMWLDVGVADEAVDARFFFVNFGFTFSRSPLPPQVASKLEIVTNEKLARETLKDVLDWTLFFAANYKLALFHKQLSVLEKTLWTGVLSHTFNPGRSHIRVNYWVQRQGIYELLITVGINRIIQLTWLVDGRVQTLPEEIAKDFAAQKLGIEPLLRQITTYHSHLLLQPLVDAFPWVQQIDDVQLALQFSATRSTQLTMDHTSGKIILQSNGPLSKMAQAAMNELRDMSKALAVLERLRLSVWQETIAQRAEAAGWIARTMLRLASGEITKFGRDAKMLLVLRLPTWTDGWFVAVALGGEIPRWVATQMVSKQRLWQVESIHDLGINTAEPDYSLFSDIGERCTDQFALYETCRELDSSNVKYLNGQNKAELILNLRSIDPAAVTWANTALRLEVHPDEVELRGRAYKDRLKDLGSFEKDGLSLNADGEFRVKVPRRKGPLLVQLSAKLEPLRKVAGSLVLAHKLSLDVLRAGLDGITLRYASAKSKDAILSIAPGVVTLDAENPQRILSPFLTTLLDRDGLGSVIELLRTTYPVYQMLSTANVLILQESPLAIVVQRNPEDLAPSDRSKDISNPPPEPQIRIELRYLGESPKLYVTGNEEAMNLASVSQLFQAPPQLEHMVPLIKGAAVDVGQSEPLLTRLVQAILQ